MLDSIIHFFVGGGVFMIPLAICSIAALTLILERSFALRRAAVIKVPLADAIVELRHGEETSRIAHISADRATTLDRLVQFALRHAPWPKQENAEMLQTRARAELSELERGLVILEIIVGIGPLLGLLGTVSGLITIFAHVSSQGQLATQGIAIAKGISEALNATVAGLSVAIPSLIAWSIFSRRIEGFAVELETLSADLLGKIYSEKAVATEAAPR